MFMQVYSRAVSKERNSVCKVLKPKLNECIFTRGMIQLFYNTSGNTLLWRSKVSKFSFRQERGSLGYNARLRILKFVSNIIKIPIAQTSNCLITAFWLLQTGTKLSLSLEEQLPRKKTYLIDQRLR